MYTYRHKKNGSTFTTPCICTGEDYEEITASASKASTPKGKSARKQKSAAEAQSADSGGENS